MPEIRIDEHSALARVASLHGRRTGVAVAALRSDARDPAFVVANEVLVNSRDVELIEEMVHRGGEVVPEPPLPAHPLWSGEDVAPPELSRREDVDMDGAPRAVTIRFTEPPRGDVPDLGALLERDERAGRRLDLSDPLAATLAALATQGRTEGRRIGLNPVGMPFTMPLSTATEGPGMAFPANPFTWAQYAGGSNVVEAWQLVDSCRQIRGGVSASFLAISDTGFWLDAAGRPRVAAGQPGSDFGAGVMQWNLQNEGQPATGPSSISGTFHGNAVASCGVGVVNNAAGAAGAGGTAATPCFFLTSLTAEHAMRCARLCVWWGIDVVNMSWGFWGQSELWFDTDTWDDTFDWAGANGLVVVAAAGNSTWNLPDDENVRPATRTPRTLTVGALDASGNAAGFSNYGSSVNLWAPGTGINVAPDGNVAAGSVVQGTSFAAPITAGVAAMMRAVNKGLSADDVRRLLVETGWPGTGRVNRGLDARAAVWAALAAGLPDSGEPNNSPGSARALLPIGPGGALAPGLGAFSALGTGGDRDYWSFEVSHLSAVTVTIDWYERLASLHVAVEPAAGGGIVDLARSGSSTAGQQVLTGLLPTGRYVVRVSGSAATAYRLTVGLAGANLAPDVFEPNDSFDAATPLAFESRRGPFRPVLWEWGPGTFELTLHEGRVLDTFVLSADFFRLNVPSSSVFRIPTVTISGADEPVDITLYDADRQELQTWSQVTGAVIQPPPDSIAYLKVDGRFPTRYVLDVRLKVKRGVLPGPQQEEVVVIPKWWDDPGPLRLLDPVAHIAVEVGREEQADGALAFELPGLDTLGGPPLRLELLDAEGNPTREAGVGDGKLVLDLSGVEPGTYALRAVRADGVPGKGLALRPVPPPM